MFCCCHAVPTPPIWDICCVSGFFNLSVYLSVSACLGVYVCVLILQSDALRQEFRKGRGMPLKGDITLHLLVVFNLI